MRHFLLWFCNPCRYRAAWESFISSWYSILPAQRRQQYNLSRRADGSIAISAAGLLKALTDGAWTQWAAQQEHAARQRLQEEQQQQQQQQQQQCGGEPGSSRGSSSSSSSSLSAAQEQLLEAMQQSKAAIWAKQCQHKVHDEVVVNGVSFVGVQHRRHKERGWAVLRKEPGSNSMWFVEVLSCVSQPDDLSPDGDEHVIVLCHLHESKPADSSRPGPKVDADGLIIFPKAPFSAAGYSIVAVPAEQLVPIRLTVVEHMNSNRYPATWVALKRIPYVDFVRAAGFPEGSGYAGV